MTTDGGGWTLIHKTDKSSGHSNYAAAGGPAEGNGCYVDGEGWNKDGNLWVK